MTIVISVENLSKSYRLGQIGTGTFAHDLNVWWAKMRGKPNPLAKIGADDSFSVSRHQSSVLWALKDVSFTVQQGEVLGIIGRNGAGKSTLLKILSRVTAPTSGRVKVRGRIASLLEVGTGFHPDLTGRENVYLNGAILGMNRRETDRKFDEIVDFAEVEKFIDTPVKRYSSGMYVRLAFAVAAHLEPEILVVDEVLAVGDAEFQKKCLGKMGDVAQEGRTVLFVSHNMVAIQNICRSALWLDGGMMREWGDILPVCFAYSQELTTPAGITDRDVSVQVQIIGDGKKDFFEWGLGETITMRIFVETKNAIKDPVIDISGFSMNNTRIFSLQSDTFLNANIERLNHHMSMDFQLTNIGISTSLVYVDIGVRSGSVIGKQYLGHFRQISTIPVAVRDLIHLKRDDTIMYVPSSVMIVELD